MLQTANKKKQNPLILKNESNLLGYYLLENDAGETIPQADVSDFQLNVETRALQLSHIIICSVL